jgi:hypothetical protein
MKAPAPKQPVNNIFNKNNLNAAKQVEVKPVPTGRVATAQPAKDPQRREDRHKAMLDDIRKKQEEFKAAKPLNVFEDKQHALARQPSAPVFQAGEDLRGNKRFVEEQYSKYVQDIGQLLEGEETTRLATEESSPKEETLDSGVVQADREDDEDLEEAAAQQEEGQYQ